MTLCGTRTLPRAGALCWTLVWIVVGHLSALFPSSSALLSIVIQQPCGRNECATSLILITYERIDRQAERQEIVEKFCRKVSKWVGIATIATMVGVGGSRR